MANLRLLIMTGLSGVLMIGCATNPNKAKKIETEIDHKSSVSKEEHIGIKDGNLVVQKKTQMNEELRRLQNDVYETEDRVYGNRKFGSEGLYGALKKCRFKISSKEYGGDGKLTWTEPIDRVTDKEDDFDIGVDEKDKIVAVSEEFLKDRIKRFNGYKRTLQKREDEYNEKLEICDASMASKKYDLEQKKKAESEQKSESN